ncbi:MAG: ureidoglycolate hydrolase [Acidimicrobiales bacterium]|jgi:ureidoglycolate lyase|nr:ureidoglycolate hydrolase [Acidimicrobiales bacterium]
MSRTITLKAEPLTSEAFAPFGQVIGVDDIRIEARDGEVLHLDIISYDRKAIRADHLNRHYKATQALVALAGRPTVIIVGPPEVDMSKDEHLDSLRAFVCDGTLGVNLGLKTWHEGPFPLGEHVDLVNVQGRFVIESDNEVAYIERDLGVVVEVAL